jgi:hypothetical protein
MKQEEPPPFDEGLGWMDILNREETEIVEEPRAPVVLTPDEPEFELGIGRQTMTQELMQSVVERGHSYGMLGDFSPCILVVFMIII